MISSKNKNNNKIIHHHNSSSSSSSDSEQDDLPPPPPPPPQLFPEDAHLAIPPSSSTSNSAPPIPQWTPPLSNNVDNLSIFKWRMKSGAERVPSISSVQRIFTGAVGQVVAAITADDKCYVWGKGAIALEGVMANIMIPYMLNVRVKVVQIVCGGGHSMVIAEDGQLRAWGDSRLAGFSVPGKYKESSEWIKSPTIVPAFKGKVVTSGAAGTFYSVVVVDWNQVYTWGRSGPWLGRGRPEDEDAFCPMRIPDFENKIQQVVCGPKHTLMLSTNGELYACGSGKNGRLGLGNDRDRTRPILLSEFAEEKVFCVSVGARHSAAIDTCGRLWVWGDNSRSQLGLLNSPKGGVLLPTIVNIPSRPLFVQVSCSFNQTFALSRSGHVFVCGTSSANEMTIWKPRILIAFSSRYITQISASRECLYALAGNEERTAVSELDPEDVLTHIVVKAVHEDSNWVLCKLILDLYSAENLILASIRKGMQKELPNVINGDFSFLSNGKPVDLEDENATTIFEILVSNDPENAAFKVKCKLKHEYNPKSGNNGAFEKYTSHSSSSQNAQKMNLAINFEETNNSIGYITISTSFSLKQCRAKILENFKTVPENFQFVSQGTVIGIKEEDLIKADVFSNLTIRVLEESSKIGTAEEKSDSAELLIRCENFDDALGTIDIDSFEKLSLKELREQMMEELEGFVPEDFLFLKIDPEKPQSFIPISKKQEHKKFCSAIANPKNEIWIRNESAEFQMKNAPPVPEAPPAPLHFNKPDGHKYANRMTKNNGMANAPIALPILTVSELEKLRAGLRKVAQQ